jgi:hypothetical protein
MKKIGIFLDDTREIDQIPSWIEEWKTVKNYKEFTDTIEKYWVVSGELPELISFDHDLALEHTLDRANKSIDAPIFYSKFKEKTGKDCAEWLVAFADQHKLIIKRACTHDDNLLGSLRIEDIINTYKKQTGNYVELPCFKTNWKYKNQ